MRSRTEVDTLNLLHTRVTHFRAPGPISVHKPRACCGLPGFVCEKVGRTGKRLSREIGATAPRHCGQPKQRFCDCRLQEHVKTQTHPRLLFSPCVVLQFSPESLLAIPELPRVDTRKLTNFCMVQAGTADRRSTHCFRPFGAQREGVVY